jgi:hypothetical protein
MVSQNFSPQGWVNLVVVLIVVGLVMGLALSDAEILNPWAAATKHAQAQLDLKFQQEKHQRELQALAAKEAREEYLKDKFAPIQQTILTVGLAFLLLELALILPLLSWGLLQRLPRPGNTQPTVAQVPVQRRPMPPELIEARLRPYVREQPTPTSTPTRGGNGYN